MSLGAWILLIGTLAILIGNNKPSKPKRWHDRHDWRNDL